MFICFIGQTPLDLCPDPNLCKTLSTYQKGGPISNSIEANSAAAAPGEPITDEASNDNPDRSTNMTTVDECLVCSDLKKEILFQPCGHITCCSACGPRVKKCLVCRETVTNRIKVISICE